MALTVRRMTEFYDWMTEVADDRVEDWLLMKTPWPSVGFIIAYLLFVWLGPKFMKNKQPFDLKSTILVYNAMLVVLSIYMFKEFLITSILGNYSYKCQPVDYSTSPLAMRMTSVCWWFFFSKVIELLDTVFFILRKKNNQVTFLHVYHHSSMIVNWWLGVKYVAGGQAFFLAMLNSFVHSIMYSYYALAAIGPHMQKYLWWKRYMTQLQLVQFFAICFHTGYNMTIDCNFPMGFNIAVFLYVLSMVALFSNFYIRSYKKKDVKNKE
ncbi:elongation of very long chain fatty acids protein 4-like [Anneissia japonica]|uniref:elongation of very long chain fatty acids protein 4-like n=1 Tax=Anneissia japonica TaxID=1529436 RepID=UPI0014256113|nr:elongation of very long chain fatty acids protein 4-like [Anneissia japonica]